MTKQERTEAIERLTQAIKRSVLAAQMLDSDDDGGTCNFDSPAIIVESTGISAQAVAKAARDLKLYATVKGRNIVTIDGFQCGMADRRTRMCQCFVQQMKQEGYKCFVEYQMD